MTNNDCPSINRLSSISKAQGAILGAAVGDALGWPQEDRARRADKQLTRSKEFPIYQFQQWLRRTGGRFYLHEEVILPGEYSDDTQLLLCTARSLLSHKEWWHYLTRQELPVWTLYERGGGTTTKRAAAMWLAGREPWLPPKKMDRQRYFEAGGNGVAMRIMPHCLLGASETNFREIAKNIVANGVCTHGHPRALVGALAYGFAMWLAFRETGTLPYGGIIEKVLSAVETWSELPDFDDIWPMWKRSAYEITAGKYNQHWRETVEEMRRLLECTRGAIEQGALAVDQEVLAQLGCFDRKINGAGTIAAAASIFLASRYAADPFHGLVEAAFASGADTDTIASMTGGLLGAVVGNEWLQDHAEQVQDTAYLRILSQDLTKERSVDKDKQSLITRISRKDIDYFIKKLKTSKRDDTVSLPDGRDTQVLKQEYHQTRSKTTLAVSWKLVTTDGQSLYIKQFARGKDSTGQETRELISGPAEMQSKIELQPVEVVKTGVQILVHDMMRARLFYEKVLGLKVLKESSVFVNLGGVIALVSADHEKDLGRQAENYTLNKNIIIYIETRSLKAAYENVRRFGAIVLNQICHRHGRRFFRCLDPDGNVVELTEAVGST
jgi:ADP-ribosylglycohydrolase/predicted enzyme related to lactoylglutathione lyase